MIETALSAVLRAQDGWVFADTPKLVICGETLVPSIAGWRRENAQRSAPDWICWIPASKSTPSEQRRTFTLYERAGTKHMWLYDPLSRQLEAYGGDGQWKFLGGFYGGHGHTTARLPPFEDIELELKPLWGL